MSNLSVIRYDDILVGAPLYTAPNGNLQSQDEGKVYIFRNNKQGVCNKLQVKFVGW